MKKIIFSLLALSLLVSSTSCDKNEVLDVDMESYNYDDFEKLPIDDYISENLTKPYNVEVIYRFDRSHSDINKNISPPVITQVQPAVDMVLEGFIKVYERVAGPTFIKTYTPKQFVLFGSHAYNSNGSVTLGTADGGRRVVLYDVNNINANSPSDISRRLQTIHHEFTHILNQIVPIQEAFRTVTTDYVADWLAAANTDAEAKALGFVSRYSRSSFPEDFAETVAHLLVKGQVWYDIYAAGSTADGKAKLKLKQSLVEDYFMKYLNIDFKKLQYEFQQTLATRYNDQSMMFLTYLKSNNIQNLVVDMDGSATAMYGKSEAFSKVWEEVRATLAPMYNNRGFKPGAFTVSFVSQTEMQVQAIFSERDGSTSYTAFYDFQMIQNPDGTINFKFVDKGIDQTQYNNGRFVFDGYVPLLRYIQNNTFTTNWVSPTIVGSGNLMKFAGFYVKDNPSSYFYGPVTLK